MDDDFRELEKQFIELRTTIRTAIWAGGIIAAIVLAFFGYTAVVAVPAAAKRALEEKSVTATVEQIQDAKKRGDDLVVQIQASAKDAEALAASLRSGRLKFEKHCLNREDNNCEPWNALPACSMGFFDAGITLDNFGAGGRCGQGSVCRLCYSFGNI